MSNERPDSDNLLNFIAATVEMIRDRMATKDDLAQLEDRLEARIDRLETKTDRLEAKTDRLEVQVIAARGDIEQVHLRLDGIDRALSTRLGQVETEMSRVRSALYLLAKDRPDVLRILGQAPPPGDDRL